MKWWVFFLLFSNATKVRMSIRNKSKRFCWIQLLASIACPNCKKQTTTDNTFSISQFSNLNVFNAQNSTVLYTGSFNFCSVELGENLFYQLKALLFLAPVAYSKWNEIWWWPPLSLATFWICICWCQACFYNFIVFIVQLVGTKALMYCFLSFFAKKKLSFLFPKIKKEIRIRIRINEKSFYQTKLKIQCWLLKRPG